MSNRMTTKVAGVTFEGRQKTVGRCRIDDPVVLIPEPENRYDRNAVIVEHREGQIGYIPRGRAIGDDDV